MFWLLTAVQELHLRCGDKPLGNLETYFDPSCNHDRVNIKYPIALTIPYKALQEQRRGAFDLSPPPRTPASLFTNPRKET